MYVWSKRLVIGLLAAFGLALGLLLIQDQDGEASVLQQQEVAPVGWTVFTSS